MSLKFGSATVIAIKDREAIRDLWEKKSHIYSDRPPSYVARLLTQNHHAAFQSMNDEWRDRRKLMSHYFSPQKCDKIHAEYQNAEALALLCTLLDEPQNYYKLLKRYSAAVTGALTYGKRPKAFEEPLCQDVGAAMGYLAENMELGATPPVDEWPFSLLQLVPSSFAFWKRRAIEHGRRMDALFAKLWNEYLGRRELAPASNCLFDEFCSQNPGAKTGGSLGTWRWGLHSLQFLGGEILEGGADTTSSTLISFVMAMACWPEYQRKAQKEMDSVVGEDRTPQWSDYDNLPYIAQIQKETLRWRCVTVTGVPHVAREDDYYKGYLIPKGARTMQSTWALHMDEEYYEEPEKFNPDRGHLIADWGGCLYKAYGAGRRICPGMHIAERNLWRSISKIIWAFDISPAIDPRTGKPEHINTAAFTVNGQHSAFIGGANRVAKPFNVVIAPRSQARVETIKREYAEAEPLLSQFD
ncbi:hypothetical protein AYO21_06898 [Fonsecaea monophora]|uniref:Cytochrome P450 n=1 Tax=Fonsecaea monophora TaxID=254056 RepID=A0A177F3G2_9EURO|nr:hypothetical protein AYO21_06898 [Fonsecaea monophora]OAG38867.1 hypothetical protein AYO21_06898 [Fonsecaea monophora]